jgi:uncharacterized protein (TIGR02271 family)
MSDKQQSKRAAIPLAKEEIRITKAFHETGRVRLRTRVVKESVVVDVPFIRDEVKVERIEIGRYVDQPPVTRQEGDTLIVPVLEEVPIVEKRLLLVAELHVKRRKATIHRRRTIQLRRAEPVVERAPAKRHKKGEQSG